LFFPFFIFPQQHQQQLDKQLPQEEQSHGVMVNHQQSQSQFPCFCSDGSDCSSSTGMAIRLCGSGDRDATADGDLTGQAALVMPVVASDEVKHNNHADEGMNEETWNTSTLTSDQ
jgi:hypothetical protein